MSSDFRPIHLGSAPTLYPAHASPLRKRLLLSLLEILNSEQVSYCLLSGYRFDPSEADSDVDLMLLPSEAARLPASMQAAAARTGALLVQALQHETSACYFVVAQPEDGVVGYLNPDCTLDYRTNGRLWLRADKILERRRPFKNFFLPAIEDEFIYYLLKKVLKGSIDASHVLRLRDLYRANPVACRTRTLEFWSGSSAASIERALLQQDVPWLQSHLAMLLTELGASGYAENFFRRIASRCGELWRVLQRVVRPTGLSVLLIGGEPQQRSDLAQALLEALGPAFRNSKVSVERTHPGSRVLSRLKSVATSAIKFRAALMRSTLVVSTSDVTVDRLQGTYGFHCLSWRDSLEQWVLPHDVAFVLTSDNVGSPATTDQQRRFQMRGFPLDSSLPLPEITRQATHVVLRYLAERLANRFNWNDQNRSRSSQASHLHLPVTNSDLEGVEGE